MPSPAHRYRVYQLVVRSDLALPAPQVAAASQVDFVRGESGAPRPFEPIPANCIYRRALPAISEPNSNRDRQGLHQRHAPGEPASASSAVALHRCGASICLRYPAADFFIEDARRVVYFPRPDAAPELLAALLLGPVCALLLELRGAACLHAGAVEMAGGAVGFLGGSGAGKSSLIAALLQAGHRLVTDDMLPVTLADGPCWAAPGYGQLKLCADAARRLAPGEAVQSLALGKHTVAVGGAGGALVESLMPLRALYVLHRAEGAARAAVEPLPASQRHLMLLAHSFCARVVGPLGLERQRFAVLAEIARRTPIRRLVVPHGLHRLCETAAVLHRDLGR